jgi:hypothetical protein
MMKLSQRIAADNVRAESVMTDPPEWADDRRDSNWYTVTLKRKRRTLTVPYGMGPALMREPSARDVVGSLVSDAAGYENARSFEEWADEYGYDHDSRKAEQTYNLIGRQAAELRRFLGDDYDAYLWKTENDI